MDMLKEDDNPKLGDYLALRDFKDVFVDEVP